jgi:hypothetical protein
MSERAVCVRCGAFRVGFQSICHACGHNPVDEGLLVAWLLSEHHLSAEALQQAADRVIAGEQIHPSGRLLNKARVALGKHFSSDPGLSVQARILLLTTSLLLTPLVGWTCWLWWRQHRPRAAWQAFGLSAPATLLFTVAVVWLRVN